MESVRLVFNQSSYKPGETFSGLVVFHYKTATKVTRLKIEIVGRSRTSWTEHVGRNVNRHTDFESYFHKRLQLVENERIVLPNEEIQFSEILPGGIPSTFSGVYGEVEYFVKIKLKRPWRLPATVKVPFKVQGQLDFSNCPNYDQPIDVSNRHSLASCVKASRSFWESPVQIDFKIPRQGYKCGESIPVTVKISNGLKDAIRNVKLSLVQARSFLFREFGGTCRREGSVVLEEMELCGKLDPGQQRILETMFKIPTGIPPTNLGGGGIIVAEYALMLSVNGKYYLDSVEANYKIIIGTTNSEESN